MLYKLSNEHFLASKKRLPRKLKKKNSKKKIEVSYSNHSFVEFNGFDTVVYVR